MSDNRDKNGRDSRGQFALGNPGGGRKRIDPEVMEMLVHASPRAAKALINALDAGSPDAPDYEIRIKAAKAILDRVYGKPTQPMSGPDGGPLTFDLTPLLERLAK